MCPPVLFYSNNRPDSAPKFVFLIIELTDADDLEQAKIIKLGEDLIAAEKNRISELIYRDVS